MSNLVLNNDTVACHECYEEMMTDLTFNSSADSLVYGTTIHLPCTHCGAPSTTEE